MSAFSRRLNEYESRLPDPKTAAREDIDAALAGMIGHTRMKFIPVGEGGIALSMMTDNPASTHYDEVFPSLIRILEGRGGAKHEKYTQNPRLIPGKATTLLETSSGSAGPSIGWIAKAYGYKPLVVSPKGMHEAFPGRADAHEQTLGPPIIFPAGKERADAVVEHALRGADGGFVESWYGSYRDGTHMKGMVDSVGEIHQAWQNKGRPGDMFFLNHSRRPEAPGAFAETGNRLIDQAKRMFNVDIDSFVGAIGNGTTVAGITQALRGRNGSARIHAFEARDDLPGTSNLAGIEMPNVHPGDFDAFSQAEPAEWEEPDAGPARDFRRFNIGKTLSETVGRTTIVALQKAEQDIQNAVARYVLVLAYDRRDRYESIVQNPDALYEGQGKWKE